MPISTKKRIILGILAFILGYFVVQIVSEYTFVRLHVASTQTTHLKIYWSTNDNAKFSEKRSSNLRVNNRKTHYVLPIHSSLSDIKHIRLDTGRKPGNRIIIGSLSLHGLSSQSVQFDSKEAFSIIQANDDIDHLEIRDTRISFSTVGSDPYLKIEVPERLNNTPVFLKIFWAVSLFLIMLVIFGTSRALAERLHFVPIALLIIACFVFSMASLSKRDSHPDEDTHISAADYYASHYCPPEVCSPESIFSYTVYGVSRLDKREIYYFLTGRYLALTDFIPASDYIKLRYFNVALLLILVILSFRSYTFRFLSLPLILSPQVWYLFSYFNSDAFSLFVVMITGYQVFSQRSMLRKLLSGNVSNKYFIWVLLLSVLVALQFWIKLNYFFYPLFLLSIGAFWIYKYGNPPIPSNWRVVLLTVLVGCSAFLSWTFLRHYINDFQLTDKVAECQELTAGYHFKPSTPPSKQQIGFHLKDKGVGLIEMVTSSDSKWFTRIFYTGLGAYGYTEYLNSTLHYRMAGISILTFFLYISTTMLFSRSTFQAYTLVISVLTFAGLVLAAAVNNWTADLQPQGRYLTVVFPILGVLLYLSRRRLSPAILYLLALIPFTLALYSFISNGMIELLKIS